MSETQFKTGDVVRLRTSKNEAPSKPTMNVHYSYIYRVVCDWFVDAIPFRETFSREALELVQETDKNDS